MSDDSKVTDEAIVKVEGTPKATDKELTRRQLISFEAVGRLLAKKAGQAGALSEEYVRAKVAQETNAAVKTAEEAADLAASREVKEAIAEKTRAETVGVREETSGTFFDNLKKIDELESPEMKALAIAKLAKEDPDLMDQLDKIGGVLQQLSLNHGTVVALVASGITVSPVVGEPTLSVPSHSDLTKHMVETHGIRENTFEVLLQVRDIYEHKMQVYEPHVIGGINAKQKAALVEDGLTDAEDRLTVKGVTAMRDLIARTKRT